MQHKSVAYLYAIEQRIKKQHVREIEHGIMV